MCEHTSALHMTTQTIKKKKTSQHIDQSELVEKIGHFFGGTVTDSLNLKFQL